MSNIKTIDEEHLESVTGGGDDIYETEIGEIEEVRAVCSKGLKNPDNPGELRLCERCEYWKLFIKNLNELGYTYYECMYKI